MKTFRWLWALVLTFMVYGCGDNVGISEPEPDMVLDLEFSGSPHLRSDIACAPGLRVFQIAVTSPIQVRFESSHPNVATVDEDGVVRAVAGATGEYYVFVTPLAENWRTSRVVGSVSSAPCAPAPSPEGSLQASPAAISLGEGSTLRWTTANATACTGISSPTGVWSGSKPLSGSEVVRPTVNTTFTLNCTGPGGSATASVQVTVSQPPLPPNPPTLTFTANPTSIVRGQSSSLSWSSSLATSCIAGEGWGGIKSTSGTQSVSPTETTTYDLVCSGAGGSIPRSVTVTVTEPTPAPTLTFTATPSSITQGGSSTLDWSSGNASSCTASGGWSGSKSLSNTQSVSPTQTTTYTLRCDGPSGSITRSATVTVTSAPAPIIVFFVADPEVIIRGQSSTLRWDTDNVTSCTASGGWSGSKSLSSTQSVSPTQDTSYNLSCTGTGGTVNLAVSVEVNDPPPALSISFVQNGGTISLGVITTLIPECRSGSTVVSCPALWWYSTVPNRIAVVPENRTYSNDPVWGTGFRTGGTIAVRQTGQATVCVHYKDDTSVQHCAVFTGQ